MARPVLDPERADDAGLAAASPLAGREIAIVTDAQATAWPRTIALGGTHVVIYRPAGDPPRDHAVLAADPDPAQWTPRGAVHGRLRAADSVTYRITLAGRTLARGIAGADGEILVHASPPERGWLAIYRRLVQPLTKGGVLLK